MTTQELVKTIAAAPANAGPRILITRTREILGVNVSVFTRQGASEFVVESLSQRRKLCVAFANHNLLLELTRHPHGSDLLKEFLVLNDGVGLNVASRLLYGTRFPENLNGSDFTPLLLRSMPVGTRVFLFGARPHVAEAAAKVIERDHEVCVCGVADGYASDHAAVASAVNRSQSDVVLVGLGNPKQEEWIAKFSSHVDAPLLVGVGAFLDFCAGAVRRAPKPVQKARLEWAFRLCLEPRRLGRRYTWDAVTFFVDVLQQKLRPSPPASSAVSPRHSKRRMAELRPRRSA
ncbi:MAG TPA: WecB/TagA/CpsF family glycosyltransferase [Pseudolabrys sp.]|nr:WecB/TagA/CpsF family glycosyltransferase [Pseudolabrys sp.]